MHFASYRLHQDWWGLDRLGFVSAAVVVVEKMYLAALDSCLVGYYPDMVVIVVETVVFDCLESCDQSFAVLDILDRGLD